MSIKEELEALFSKDGMLHPHVVVEWARTHPDSELHREFEWDDAKAADRFRNDQARRLIQIHLVVDNERTVFSLVSDRVRGGGYRPTDEVFNTEGMRAEAVEMALAEIRRWRERYAHLAPELSSIFRVIDRAGAVPAATARPGRPERPRPSA